MNKKIKFNNVETFEGYVYSTGTSFNELSKRVTGENSKNPGTEYIAGDLDIAVDEEGLDVISIHYTYITPFYKSGKVNNTYAALEEIINHPENTWIKGGKENAYKVKCTGVAIGINDFIAGDGSKVASPRNENGFCSIIKDFTDDKPKSQFTTDMLITKVTHMDANPEKNVLEDYVSVSGYIFGYGATIPTILPVSFVVRNEAGMNYFENMEIDGSNPVFTKVWGRPVCKTIKVEQREESAFGEAFVQTNPRKNREYLITGTAKVPYDFGDEEVLTVADVNKMTQDRQVILAEIEKRFNERKNNKEPKTAEVPEGSFVF